MTNRLYKSREQKVLDGVCGGLAEYFDVDAVLIRVLWVIISIFAGAGVFGIFAYLIAMIIMPSRPAGDTPAKKYVANQNGELVLDDEKDDSDTQRFTAGADHSEDYDQEVKANRHKAKTWLGLILIVVGCGILLERVLNIDLSWWLYAYSSYIWPLVLIILGVLLLTRRSS